MADIRAQHPSARLDLIQLDLCDRTSIRAFADAFKVKYDKLDVLCNNAGLMLQPFKKLADGWEQTFVANAAGHYLLTMLLLDPLERAEAGRIISVSALAGFHASSNNKAFLNDGTQDSTRNQLTRYTYSKGAAVALVDSLIELLQRRRSRVLALIAHPGVCGTNLSDDFFGRLGFLKGIFVGFLPTAALGAAPYLLAATDKTAEPGDFYGPGGYGAWRGWPIKSSVPGEVGQNVALRREMLALMREWAGKDAE